MLCVPLLAMTNKTSPTGWVVQVTIPAQPEQAAPPERPDLPGVASRPTFVPAAPLFKYFNVAMPDARKAIEATTKHVAEAGETTVVRALSPEEIAALRLKPGAVRPA